MLPRETHLNSERKFGNIKTTKYLIISERVFNAVNCRIIQDSSGNVELRDVSGPTNPLPRWVYKTVKEEINALYGIGIYLMTCAEIKS